MEEKSGGLLGRYLKILLIMMLLVITACNIAFKNDRPGWSPVDELQHYDYIDNLSQLKRPSAKNDVTQYSRHITFDVFRHSREEKWGIALKSYEAHQPPFYYAVMAPPNILLKALGAAPVLQIKILRLISLCFTFLGCYFVIPIFYELRKLFGVNELHGYVFAVILLLPYAEFRNALSNENLCLFMNNLVIYLLLVFWRKQDIAYAAWAALAVVLAFLTKYTNGLMFLLYAAVLLGHVFQSKQYDNALKKMKAAARAALPFSLILVYLAVNIMTYGWGDPLNTKTTNANFSTFVFPVKNVYLFIFMMIRNSLDFSRYNHFFVSNTIVTAAAAMILFNFFSGGYHVLFRKKYSYVPIFAAGTMSVFIVVSGLVLNNNVSGVYWFNRHFYGYGLFWMTAIFYCPFFMLWAHGRTFFTCAALMAAPLMLYYATWSQPNDFLYKIINGRKQAALYIVNEGAQKCLERQDNRNFSHIYAADCADKPPQLWIYSGLYKVIFNDIELQCVNNPIPFVFRNESPVDIHDCTGNANQQWIYDEKSRRFKNFGRRCLEVFEDNGQYRVRVNECDDGLNQKWVLMKNPPSQ